MPGASLMLSRCLRLAAEARSGCRRSVQARRRQEEVRPEVGWMRAEGKTFPRSPYNAAIVVLEGSERAVIASSPGPAVLRSGCASVAVR